MAGGMQNTSSVGTRRFDKSLNEDVNDFHLPDNSWTQARNAINNSITGDLGKLGNEPSNLFCTAAPYTIIGITHFIGDKWGIFSTDNTNSEIGIFEESTCTYTTVVNNQCLNFRKDNLIKGVSRATSDCVFNMYWDDGLNPSRAMSVDVSNPANNVYTSPNSPVPWIQDCTVIDSCNICDNTPDLDCDAIRLARFIQYPCIEATNGVGAGTLLNGSYMVAIAYAIDGQKISDWYLSNVQGLFNHTNAASSLDVTLSSIDQDFDQILVALISVTNQQTVARLAGTYSTRQTALSFDTIDNTWPAVPIEEFPLMTPIADKTDAMYNVNDYLIRVGPTSKQDFNYQPLANQIVAKWQSVEYPANYYRKGGNNTNYLRDEVYPFFIRWVYDTGDKSSSYHIPGRPSGTFWINPTTGFPESDFLPVANADAAPELSEGLPAYNWNVYNTATNILIAPVTLPDGGVVVGEGYMGYWESTEIYPDNLPDVWDANIAISPYPGVLGSAHNLCGKPIRHHRFPDMGLSAQTEYIDPNTSNIRIMGVKFENIKFPVLNDGVTPVPGIVGYEILRGARNGNKTILAKGLINNMRLYEVPNGITTRIGAYPNYPYNETGQDSFSPAQPILFNGRPDPYMSTTETVNSGCPIFGGGVSPETNYNGQTAYSKFLFTFHSPDTNFTDPFLSAKELKVHGEMNGDVVGKFEKSEEHPKEKLLTNLAFGLSAIAGLGIAALAMNGKRTTNYIPPHTPGYSQDPLTFWVAATPALVPTPVIPIPGTQGQQPQLADIASIPLTLTGLTTAINTADLALSPVAQLIQNTLGFGTGPTYQALQTAFNVASANTAYTTTLTEYVQEDGAYDRIPGPLIALANLPMFFNYFTQGTDTVLDFFKAVVRYRDFALRYHSHCLYNRYRAPVLGNMRRVIETQEYVGPQITDFGLNVRINNLYRSTNVSIGLKLPDPTFPHTYIENTQVNDVTRIIASQVNPLLDNDIFGNPNALVDPTRASFGPGAGYGTLTPITAGNAGLFYPGHSGIQIASSHYASLKQRIRNQYGQINGVMQVPASTCLQTAPTPLVPISSDTIFGGDTYVGRYTEKNTFFYFYNWLYGQPDGAQFDYTKNEMLPYPRFWANFDQFETGDFTASIASIVTTGFAGVILPNDYYNLDGLNCGLGFFSNLRIAVRNAYFYLFNSGVKDFYVESEINIDLRDWGALETEQHYDPYRYTDTRALFDTKYIKATNYYKYDQSLSVSKLFINYISWASAQNSNYDPNLAEACYVYQPNRVLYSLPAQYEGTRDNWYLFLANNYKDFLTKVTCIKPINKSGAMIFFENESPIQFQGLDQLETGLGTKLTIGDGGLFTQPMQNIVNVDKPYEYASCQDRLSVINTPAGVFWISQNQGKIFNFQGQLDEISMRDLKWWFAAYLPYKLTQQFPNFTLKDNPVIGIGCQSIYDNENSLIYFTKRDFIVRTDLPVGTTVEYVTSDDFQVFVDGVFQFDIKLGDPNYFEDASWTVSYDPKSKGWISFHDWHPNLMIPGKNTFMTTLDTGIWIHNQRCDSYCNYYGINYPFEVEYMVNTVQTVNTLRSIEYIMEVYRYAPNCFDRFHVLDFNFDEAVVYNTEQVSGLLRLNLSPNNNPQEMILYPIINFNYIDILFSKVEQKYRFDQFWDITDDRGEFNPAAQRVIWNTGANGYIRVLNPNNLNYNKEEFQRKPFRHYTNSVFLRRRVSGDRKILVMLTNNKNLYSPR
jgi:hypothetical protein